MIHEAKVMNQQNIFRKLRKKDNIASLPMLHPSI